MMTFKIAISGRRPKYWSAYKGENAEFFSQLLFSELLSIVIQRDSLSFPIETMWEEKKGGVELITGMAEGIDILWALTGISNKIPVHCYIPCTDQARYMENQWGEFWNDILNLDKKDPVFRVDCYKGLRDTNLSCYKERNVRMIEDCDFALIVWDGLERGGTYHFLKEYKKSKKPYKLCKY